MGEGAEIKVVYYSTPTDLIKKIKRNINNDRSPTMECIIRDACYTYPIKIQLPANHISLCSAVSKIPFFSNEVIAGKRPSITSRWGFDCFTIPSRVSFILIRLLQAVSNRYWLIIENKWIVLTREWIANRIEIGWQKNQVT